MSQLNIDYGYKLPSDLRPSINKYRQKRRYISILLAFSDHILIWIPGMVVFYLRHDLLIWTYALLCVVSARSMRGLECLVHDASHYNILKRKKYEDFFGNIFFAIPVFSKVQDYRASHSKHHDYLGTIHDPDKVRHHELRLDTLDRSNPYTFIFCLLSKLPRYVPGWWRAIGTTWKTSLISLCWHFLLIVIPLSMVSGLKNAIFYWLLFFGVPFAFFLPILRFVGEAAEHDYSSKMSIAIGTFSNTGLIHTLIFHPHCDGYHTLHHVFPFIPHCNLPDLNRHLNICDNKNWNMFLRERKGVFQNV